RARLLRQQMRALAPTRSGTAASYAARGQELPCCRTPMIGSAWPHRRMSVARHNGRRSLAEEVEEIVHADLERVKVLVNLDVERPETNSLVAEVHVVVLGLDRPVRRDCVFEASPDRPPGPILLDVEVEVLSAGEERAPGEKKLAGVCFAERGA